MRHGPRLALLAVLAGCAGPEPLPERPLPLVPGTEIEAGLAGGESHVWLISPLPGSFVDLAVDQRGIDVELSLTGPDGLPFPKVDSPNGARGPEPLPLIADAEGSFRLAVRASSGAPGRYAVTVRAVRPATPADRRRVAAERTFAQGEELRRRADGPSLSAAVARDREAAELFRRLGDPARRADALYALGRVHTALGEAGPALAAFAGAGSLFRAQGRPAELGRTLNSLGPHQLALGDPAAALASYEESLALHRVLGDRRGEATALNNLGRLHASQGRAGQALAAYDGALPLWRALKLPAEEGTTLANRGGLFAFLGETERAADDLGRALPLLTAAGRRREAAWALGDLGTLAAADGRPAEARAAFQKALELQKAAGDRRGEAVTLNSLGLLAQSEGRPEEARRTLAASLAVFRALGDRPNEAAVLVNLGRLDARRGEVRAAEAAFARALPAFEAAGRRAGEAAAWAGLADARSRLGDPRGALDAAEAALARIESLRAEPPDGGLRASFLATHQEVYALAIGLRMELDRREPGAGHDARALETSERARARSLLDDLAGAGAGAQAEAASLAEIRREILDGDTLLLEYALGETRSHLWAVDRQGIASFELPPRAEIEAAARRAHLLLAGSRRLLARPRVDRELAGLSRMLLEPVAGRLGGRRLLVVPDGALHLVPFGALPDPDGPAGPLLARHEVATLPSASALVGIRRRAAGRRPAPGVVAVLADPVFDPRDPRVTGSPGGSPGPGPARRFVRLPHSREEARALLALAPPGDRLEALDFAASRETATAGALARYRVVHFATHAVLDPGRPERSGIALSLVDARGRPRDGFLRASEIYRLRVAADLVVLSACETALGREIRGEGIVGLPRAFLHAGARGVVVSLWPVEDRATADLMAGFYSGLFGRGLPPAAALREAQDALRRQPGRESPYHWAGFVLQGDGR